MQKNLRPPGSRSPFGDTVKVPFKGTLDDGTGFVSTSEASPLEFTIGEGTLIQGFEEETVGMTEQDLTIDANPPLVGRALNFDIELVEFV